MSLHWGSVQVAVLATFVVIAVTFAALFVVVARQSRREVAYDRVSTVGYRLRRPWFLGLVVVLTSVLAALTFFVPASSSGDAIEVRIVGGQFYWSLAPDRFTNGERVVFDVSSADVNHGLGLYDPGGRLIGSVQAMPGYRNRLWVTLDKPGTWTIACFEYCGLEHHEMIREFEVAP